MATSSEEEQGGLSQDVSGRGTDGVPARRWVAGRDADIASIAYSRTLLQGLAQAGRRKRSERRATSFEGFKDSRFQMSAPDSVKWTHEDTGLRAIFWMLLRTAASDFQLGFII